MMWRRWLVPTGRGRHGAGIWTPSHYVIAEAIKPVTHAHALWVTSGNRHD